MRAGRQALVREVGRGSREQVIGLEAVMMSAMWEESTGMKVLKERGGERIGGVRGGRSGRVGDKGRE